MMNKFVAMSTAGLAACSLLASSAAIAAAPANEAEVALKELLVAMKYKEMMTESMKQMLKNMPQVMMQASSSTIEKNTKLNAEQKKIALGKAEKDIKKATIAVEGILTDPKLMDELEKEMVPLYAKYFKAEEIRQIAAFYKTPVGNKLLATFPQIMGESSMIAQKIVMPRVEQQVEKFASEHAK
jgi:hypothetical protein